ncbi:GAF domain-containing protein [Halosegnis sp.]|uniref:GAF domain-containing protein n=1 Tax=Halosegnis sp. TaxID=2864959 RepID=UPI0035D46E58
MSETTVLVVDDEANQRDLTATYLERLDDAFRTVTAADAESGLEQLAAESVDCIVSDYEMPSCDGLTFFRRVRERHAELPFILFTGKGSEEIASEALSAGVTDYLQKSGGADQYEVLANRIRNAVVRASAEQRATELARINELIREVQTELVQAETREEIQRVVCETLTDADPYTLAWVGIPDETTGVVEPVAAGGDGVGYVEELTVRFDDTPRGRGPGGQAVRSREPQVINEAGADPALDAWRELTDQYGIESLMVLPLVDNDQLYGIIPVYADRPAAFDDEEQAVLTELADTVAAAITAAETRRRLEQYETVVDSVGDPMYVVDTEGHFEFVSEPLAALLGTDRETLLGTHVSAYLADGETERLEQRVAELLSTGQQRTTVEMRMKRADGTTIPCEDHLSLLPFEEEFRGTTGVVRDISERYADEQVRERLYEIATDPEPDAEETARRLLDIGRERLGLAEGKLIRVDPEQDRHETVVTTADDSLEGDVSDLSETFCRAVVGDGLLAVHETSNSEWSDVAERWDRESYLGTEVRVDGETYGTVCFVDPAPTTEFTDRDRSFVELVAQTLGHELERRRAREQTERREATLRRLHREVATDRPLAETIEAVLDLGRETLGATHGVVANVTRDRYEMEFVRSDRETVRPGAVFDVEETGCVFTIREEETTSVAAMDEQDDWRELPIHTEVGMNCYIGTPLFVDGQLYGTLCFLDEEARVESFTGWEKTLVELMGQWVSRLLAERQSQQLLERERDRLEEFASTLSHDLQTPLSVAAGRVDLAAEACTCGEATESLDIAADAIERTEALVADTLALARQGKAIGETEPVDLAALVETVWRDLATDAATLEVRALPTVEADPGRLRRLLSNVLSNSIEHAGPDVTVTVGATDRGFYVADDGPGIPDEWHETVFKRGQSTAEDGTGFGLSIVQRIAEAHGWTVTAGAAAEGGARFDFTGVTTTE